MSRDPIEALTNGFARTRRDHRVEIAEDYVELVAELISERGEARVADMAKRLGVSSVTVSKTVRRLARDGYLRSDPYRSVFLTTLGSKLAAESKERHALVLGLLRAIGVPKEIAESDSEGMEHHISPETLESIRRFLHT